MFRRRILMFRTAGGRWRANPRRAERMQTAARHGLPLEDASLPCVREAGDHKATEEGRERSARHPIAD